MTDAVLPPLHQRLLELASYRHHALVLEAPYEHFLDQKKTRCYSPAFCARAIAEFYPGHTGLRSCSAATARPRTARPSATSPQSGLSAKAEAPGPAAVSPCRGLE